MSVFEAPDFAEHDIVQFCRDARSGLSAIIAVHDRALGPAAGGCRMWPYVSSVAALRDVLRLSRAMSYKNAMAGLPLGGGKSVIIGDPATDKTPALFRALGRFIDGLGGAYIGAEDVGVTPEDMAQVASQTGHVAGLNKGAHASGDPSPLTAYGVFRGIEAAAAHKLGRDDLEGLRVAVQGVGHVGYYLCQRLAEAGAELVVADVDAAALARVRDEFSAHIVAPQDILAAPVDVLAPCAMGAVLNDQAIARLQAVIVAGSANNQLAAPRHGASLRARGILYAPDYVINAGGIINAADEMLGRDYDRGKVVVQVSAIYDTLRDVFARAEAEQKPTNVVADAMARQRLAAAQRKKYGAAARFPKVA
jgi:leucine dehydrogenase